MLKLEVPSLKFKKSFLNGLEEFSLSSQKSSWVYMGESYPLDYPSTHFESYLGELLARETKAVPNFVCDTTYWAIQNNEVVGRISLRHELNEFLLKVGGHIGYIVRTKHQNLGLATEMLRLILQTSRAREIGELLITCDESNIASEKVILKNGGVFEGISVVGEGRPLKKRFWIRAT